MRKAAFVLSCVLLILLNSSRSWASDGQHRVPGVLRTSERLSPAGIAGQVIVHRGLELPDRVVQLVRQQAKRQKVVVIALGDAEPDVLSAKLRGPGEEDPTVVEVRLQDTSTAPADLLNILAECSAVWLTADDSAIDGEFVRQSSTLIDALRAVRSRGGVVGLAGGATSLIAGDAAVDLLPGVALGKPDGGSPADGLVWFSLEDNATLLVQGRAVQMLGGTAITVSFAASPVRDVRAQTLRPGESTDYNELRRVAAARSAERFPPEMVGEPRVEHGALVLVGGGGMPRAAAQRFFELGGSEDGVFVVLPTAMPDPLPETDFGEVMLRRLGAKSVTVLRGREQAEVDTAENLALMERATGIWFGGGRQWRFVDAYEGTKLAAAMHRVLQRGGVIGGSSAGATIQGDYLVRGAPAGPHIMMCEGYERGFAFLKGVAIDQHFAQRRRFRDMSKLMDIYPQYLGIGLDEDTAVVVQGHVAEILGSGEVHFFDRRRSREASEPDHESFRNGMKYDLVERKAVAGP